MSTANTIVLKGRGQHEEFRADAALNPGNLLQVNSDNEVLKHAVASGPTQRLFAKEDALQGNIKTTAYAAGDLVSVHVAVPGDVLNLLLKDGETIVIGDALTSNADGTLKEYVAPTGAAEDFHIVGYATEALSPSGADDFIDVRIV